MHIRMLSPCSLFLLVLLNTTVHLISAQAQVQQPTWNTIPFSAPAIPLAVKSPHLQAWLRQGPKPPQNGAQWPSFWTSDSLPLGWAAAVRVDGTSYSLLGGPTDLTRILAIQKSVNITSTKSIFTYQAGNVSVTATFLSPIVPSDLVRQTIPFSYMSIQVASSDGKPHAVQLYSDITAGKKFLTFTSDNNADYSSEWISGNPDSVAQWSSNTSGNYIILQASRSLPMAFSEIEDKAEDGTVYFAMAKNSGVSWQIGPHASVRGQFNNTGALNNTQDNTFRQIQNDFQVFGISADNMNIQDSSPVVWALGFVRDPVLQYGTSTGIETRSAYWRTRFETGELMTEFFVDDYGNAILTSDEFDRKVQNDAISVSGSELYSDLISLSLRQVLGAMDITVKSSTNNEWDTSDVKIFVKDLGGIGVGGINSVDVLYASFPAYLYLNATLGRYLLAPLLEYQDSSLYSDVSAMAGFGPQYPNATNANSLPQFQIESTASMLIMTSAYSQASGDHSLISQHYNLLQNWTNFLVNNTLYPGNAQRTVDNLTYPNQTNLAIKGIIAIGAMAQISALIGNTDDQQLFQNTANSYVEEWSRLVTMTTDGSKLLAQYGDETSFGMTYNLYADKLLGLNLVSSEIYERLINYYVQSALPESTSAHGIPLDWSTSVSRTDWTMLAAGIITTDNVTLSNVISVVHGLASSQLSGLPFGVEYDSSNGTLLADSGIASPAQGAMFSLLAPKIQASLPVISKGSKKSKRGVIVGGILGGVLALAACLAILFYLRRKRTNRYRLRPFTSIFPYDTDSIELPVRVSRAEKRDSMTLESANDSNPTGEWRPLPSSTTPIPFELGIRDREFSNNNGVPTAGRNDTVESALANGDHGSNASSSSEEVIYRGIAAKQTLVNEQLRREVDNLRQTLERLQAESSRSGRLGQVLDEAFDDHPPSYTNLTFVP